MALKAITGILLGIQAFLPSVRGQAAGLFGLSNQGDGTYYQTTFGSGACSFAQGNVQYSPWLSGTNVIVAVNAPQWFGSQTCGLCLSYKGLGPGAGANPIPQNTQYAIVGDLCPECLTGALDLATTGDGRWTIEWTPVQCNVANNSFVYSFQGSNPYYIKLQVANTRVPVQSVSIQYNGALTQMDRSSDNYFIAFANGGGAFQLPTQLAITSVLGDTVFDTLATSTPSGNVPGTVQFPLSSQWDTVGGQSSPGTQTTPVILSPPTSAPTSASTPAATSAPTPTPTSASTPAPTTASNPAATSASTPAPTTSPCPAATSTSTPAATSASTPAATPASTPSSQVNKPPPPTPIFIHSPPPPALNLSAPLAAQNISQTPFVNKVPSGVQSSLPIQPYQQCGGSGAACLGAQCADAPYPSTSCAADSTGQAFGCSRVNQYYWQCLPSRLAAVQNAGFQAAASVAAPPSGAIEEAAPCDVPIGNNQQCGGNGAYCSVTANGAACGDQEWSGACCATSGYSCLRYSASYYECRSSPFL